MSSDYDVARPNSFVTASVSRLCLWRLGSSEGSRGDACVPSAAVDSNCINEGLLGARRPASGTDGEGKIDTVIVDIGIGIGIGDEAMWRPQVQMVMARST